MSRYNGGKKMLGKYIYNAIQQYIDTNNITYDTYFEPFCGMCGVLVHFSRNTSYNILACDANEDVFLLWKAIINGWIPPDSIDEETYTEFKQLKEKSALRGFIGIGCSYGGAYFSGYLGKYTDREFVRTAKQGLLRYKNDLKDVCFLDARSYDTFNPKNTVIYCDPPYKGNKVPSVYFRGFDHDHFWNMMRKWSRNNIVFISESNAPDDFECIWTKEDGKTFRNDRKIIKENLYTLKSI